MAQNGTNLVYTNRCEQGSLRLCVATPESDTIKPRLKPATPGPSMVRVAGNSSPCNKCKRSEFWLANKCPLLMSCGMTEFKNWDSLVRKDGG
jgi:hypothetical protein